MDKIATLVKEAEVRGVLAGLVDGGHLKLASYEELDAFTEAVASMLPDNSYGLEDVLNKTAELIAYIESGDMEKEASEELDETALMAAFGELTMMKMAGQIDDETFEKEAVDIQSLLAGAKNMAGKAWGGIKAAPGKSWDGLKNAATGKQMRAGHRVLRDAKAEGKSKFMDYRRLRENFDDGIDKAKRDRLVGAAKTLGLYGTGVTAAGVGGKALYDKYKN